MTNNEVAVRGETSLTIHDEQAAFTDTQLRALGFSDRAPRDVVETFFHVVKRTGLDPFARQVYAIERGGKWTFQTGIDGYRLTAHRAARRDGVPLSVDAPQWAGPDGVWRDLWTEQRPPAAARVTVWRNGESFTHTCMFREYAQTKAGGEPVAMWAKMPANQLAKCAEAAAFRKAFPADLSGVYVDDEMQQADAPPRGAGRSRASRATVTLQSVQQPTGQAPSRETWQEMLGVLDELFPNDAVDTPEGGRVRRQFMGYVLGRDVDDPRVPEADMVTVVEAAREALASQRDGGGPQQ